MQPMCKKRTENSVLLVQYSRDSGENVRKVTVNKEEGMQSQREWMLLRNLRYCC